MGKPGPGIPEMQFAYFPYLVAGNNFHPLFNTTPKIKARK
jgi:hypothetical protein